MMAHFILSVFFISFSVMAAEISPRNPHPEISNLFESNKNKKDIIPESELHPYEANASILYGQGRFKQSGDGQSYDTKAALGTGVGFEVVKKNGETFFKLSGQVSNTSFKEPSNIGGENVTVGRQIWKFTFGKNNVFQIPQFSADAGLGSIIQNADKFSNSAKLVPEYMSLGPTVGLRWTQQLSETWALTTSGTLIVPIFFKDVGANNGNHTYGVYSSLGSMLRARLNRQLFFNFGILLESEKHVFSGTGSRGVKNADVSYFAIVLPMGINYVF